MTKRSVYHFKCAVILERLHHKKNKFRLLDEGFRLFEWDAGRKAFGKAIAKIYPQLDSTKIKIIVIDDDGDEIITNPSVPSQLTHFRHWMDHNHSEGEMIKIFIEQTSSHLQTVVSAAATEISIVKSAADGIDGADTRQQQWLLQIQQVPQKTAYALKCLLECIKSYVGRITKEQVYLVIGIFIIISAVLLFTYFAMNSSGNERDKFYYSRG